MINAIVFLAALALPQVSFADFRCTTICHTDTSKIINSYFSRSETDEKDFIESCDLLGGTEVSFYWIHRACFDSSYTFDDNITGSSTTIDVCLKDEVKSSVAIAEGTNTIDTKRESQSLCQRRLKQEVKVGEVCRKVGSYTRNVADRKDTNCVEI